MRTSAWLAADLLVDAADALTLEAGDAESSSDFPDELNACHPSNRKITPRKSSTMTMARRGRPVESGTRSVTGPL